MLEQIYNTFAKFILTLLSGLNVSKAFEPVLARIAAMRKSEFRNSQKISSCTFIPHELNRRHALFCQTFFKYSKTDLHGLMIRSRDLKNPEEWNLKTVLAASRLTHDYFLDPRFTEPDGVVFDGEVDTLWKNLEDSAVGGLTWNELDLSQKRVDKLIAKIDRNAECELSIQLSIRELLRILQNISGLNRSKDVLNKAFAAGGFLARGTLLGEPDIPACIFGYPDLVLYSSRRDEPKIAATGEFKKRPPLTAGATEKFGRPDGLIAQNWVSGIGSGCKRFFSLSNNGFKLFWLTKDLSLQPAEDGPQERLIIEMYPPGADMASFDEFENRQIFLRFLHGLARASGILPLATSSPGKSDSSSSDDDESDEKSSEDEPGRFDENSEDSSSQETAKREKKTGSTKNRKTIKYVPQELKHKRAPSQSTTTTLIKGRSNSADMTLVRVNIESLDKNIQEALSRIGRELYQHMEETVEDFEADLIM